MKTFLQTVGVIGAFFSFGACIAAVWVGDYRWCITGVMTALTTYGMFVWASNTPRHDEVCGGC